MRSLHQSPLGPQVRAELRLGVQARICFVYERPDPPVQSPRETSASAGSEVATRPNRRNRWRRAVSPGSNRACGIGQGRCQAGDIRA